MPLTPVNCGWKWLESTLNDIIGEVNTNNPLPSGTIAIQRTNQGSLLTVTKPKTDTTQSTTSGGGGGGGTDMTKGPDGLQAGWTQLYIVDQSCNRYVMWVWGTSPQLVT